MKPRVVDSSRHRTRAEEEPQALHSLGTGGPEDRLRFRLVLQIFRRCFPLLRGVRWHLAGVILGGAVLAIVLLPPALLLADILWTRVLQGHPLTTFEAAFLRLDPALTVSVDALERLANDCDLL